MWRLERGDYAHSSELHTDGAHHGSRRTRTRASGAGRKRKTKAGGCARGPDACLVTVTALPLGMTLDVGELSAREKNSPSHTTHQKHGLSAPRVPGTTQAGGGKARRGLTVYSAGDLNDRTSISPTSVESRTHAAALWRSQRRGTCGCAGGELNTSVGTVFLQRCSRSMLPGGATPRSFWPCTYGWGRANCSADGTRPFAPVCMPYTALDLDGWGRWRSLHPPRPQPSPSV